MEAEVEDQGMLWMITVHRLLSFFSCLFSCWYCRLYGITVSTKSTERVGNMVLSLFHLFHWGESASRALLWTSFVSMEVF